MVGTFAVFAGIGLTGPVSAAPSPGRSSSLSATPLLGAIPYPTATPLPGATPPPGRPLSLGAALLSESDMPRGYEAQTRTRFDEMVTTALAGYRPGADPCTAPPPGAAPAARPLTDQVKAKQFRPATPDPGSGRTVTAVFLHERTGVAAVEALAAPGEKTAAGMIDDAARVLAVCPVITTAGGRLTLSPSSWNPSLGDDSITVRMRFDWDDPAAGTALLGGMALVAYRDLVVIVGLIGAREPSERDLKNVVRAAVRKVVLSTGISVKETT